METQIRFLRDLFIHGQGSLLIDDQDLLVPSSFPIPSTSRRLSITPGGLYLRWFGIEEVPSSFVTKPAPVDRCKCLVDRATPLPAD